MSKPIYFGLKEKEFEQFRDAGREIGHGWLKSVLNNHANDMNKVTNLTLQLRQGSIHVIASEIVNLVKLKQNDDMPKLSINEWAEEYKEEIINEVLFMLNSGQLKEVKNHDD